MSVPGQSPNQRAAAPWAQGHFWGQFLAITDLVNVAGAAYQIDEDLQAGDVAWVDGTSFPYVCLDPTPGAAVWAAFVIGAGGGDTLQTAYNTGNTIAATAARPVAISNAVDATDIMTLTRTFVGAGDGMLIDMGPGGEAVSGSAINIQVGGNAFGFGVIIENPTSPDRIRISQFGISYGPSGANGDFEIVGEAGTAPGGGPRNFNIAGGTGGAAGGGSAAATGGVLNWRAGNGGTGGAGGGESPGAGGQVTLAGGNAGAFAGIGTAVGGSLTLTSGDSVLGSGGADIIATAGDGGVGSGGSAGGAGGDIDITAGLAGGDGGAGQGSGGEVRITGGTQPAEAGTSAGTGGAVTITGGVGGASAGTDTGNAGGAAILEGGTGGVSLGVQSGGTGGPAGVIGGAGGAGTAAQAGAPGGAASITGGIAGADAGGGGAIGGAVSIFGGAGTGAAVDGDVNIGTLQTEDVNIAASNNLGFHGVVAIPQQTVVGSRAGNAALASLLTVLDASGLLIDGSSA